MGKLNWYKPEVLLAILLWYCARQEEEEGSRIASDVIKVESEDPATPGDYLRSVDVRTRRDCNDFPISGY